MSSEKERAAILRFAQFPEAAEALEVMKSLGLAKVTRQAARMLRDGKVTAEQAAVILEMSADVMDVIEGIVKSMDELAIVMGLRR